ncbi:cytochrome c biogenesis protein CcsA [Nitriliruptor alkaliphilus]|uniref:cytochrome c biogenesis protein CcsA n=1 Tax=Nitriliruptor alkaliphilus TaxID=427918 RepID=UPI000697A6C1|nr:cytochrome c biogenesis protein CcsA [Nitriliruptor alkaliphilus]
MPQDLAELSRFLYSPVTLLLYVAATGANLYALTARAAPEGSRSGRVLPGTRAQQLGIVLAVLAVVAHIAHEVVRGIAQQRLPLGNMFEFSSAMALTGAIAGIVYLVVIRKRPELLGFVMLGATLVVGSAMLAYSDPGPLQPILDTWWRSFHVSIIVAAAGILTVGFVFTALYLLRDTAERYVAEGRSAVTSGSTVGAAHVSDLTSADDASSVDERVAPDTLGDAAPGDTVVQTSDAAAYRVALRRGISAPKLAIGTFLGTSTVSWIYIATPTLDLSTGIQRFLTINLTLVAAALLSRWFVGFLPPAATLDNLAYRTIALGFFAWTFGVIAGAMWAEQSWGRFWGWDPKETGSFLTWVAYAAYLHARATRGARGRSAGWIGLWAFAVLMFAYQGVNLVIVGLHSYAGL